LHRAYAEAGVDPASVGYLETAATACPDADRPEAQVLDTFFGAAGRTTPCRLGSVQADVGHCGAASGLVAVVKASLALYQEVLPALRGLQQPLPELAGMRQLLAPAAVQYWVRDRAGGPRRAGVSAASVDGNFMHVVLEACENQVNERVSTERRRPLGNSAEKLFLLAAPDRASLLQELEKRREISASNPGRAVELLADAWGRKSAGHAQAPGEWLLLVAQDTAQLLRLLEHARQRVQGDAAGDSGLPRQDRDRIFYTPRDKRLSGGLAFVFPGAGNTFAGMGRELALYWPEILRTQDRENRRLASQMFADRFWNAAPGSEIGTDHRAVICGQVALGTLLSDLALSLGLKPDAALGYSLGEATGLFALRAWRNRDEMLRRVSQSTLFAQDLTGTPDRLRQLWRVAAGQAVQWQAGLVDRSAAEVRAAMAGLERLYLLIVNTPGECVVGGDAAQVRALVAKLGSHWWPLEGVSTVHCELLRPVEAAYRELHRFETTPPAGVQFFSGGWGRAYVPDRETAAAAIVAQAGDCIDFPRVVRAAYDSGIRFFLELGPGNSCSRMIGQILEGRPHVARSLCATAQEPLLGVLRVLGHLAAEGVPLDLSQLRQPPAEAPVKPETARTPQVRIPIVSPLLAATPTAVVAPNAPRASQVLTASAADVELPVPEAQPVAVFVGESVDPFEEQFLAGLAGAQAAALKAHEAYLSFSQGVVETLAQTVQAQLGAIATLAAAQFEVPAQAGVGNGRRALDSGPPRSGVSAERRQIDDCGKSAALCRDATRPQLTSSESARQSPSVALDRAACLEFARGSVAQVLGPEFRRVDSFPTRVRLPDEPLMLVDRILQIEGEARSMTHGRVVTEHDILPGAWYLDGDRIPTCIAVEAGQADLFLSGYLGIDFQTEGRAVYRLLDAKVRFHRGLPGPGAVIHYDIRIDRFFRQGNTWLFRFDFEATVDGQPLLTMTEGCAGFFSAAELAGGRGIVRTAMELQPRPGKRAADWEDWVTVGVESYSSDQLDALRQGDLASCLGPQFAGLTLRQPVTLPTGRMKLVHRITRLDPAGGRFGLGLVRGEADIHPDDWFLTCHFVDDRVMPGTLMFECCLHTLRVLLLRLGWVAEQDTVALEPVPGVASQLKCRGQVLATTARVTYEVVLKEIGYRPEPYVIADALMYADDKPIVEITDMSLRYTGVTRETLRQTWAATNSPADPVQPPLYGPERILAFAIGKPSVAFGAPYAVFDEQRRIARLPGPPYQFLDRITEVQGEPFQMVPGGGAVAQYDIPAGAWYFAANRQDGMPFAVLLEIALQPCGWLAAYAGSALTSDVDLSFRNLGGTGTQRRAVWPTTGTLTTRVKMTRASSSAGMIIQWYDLEVRSAAGLVYKGDTYFGFFPPAALARQEGIREARLYPCSAEEVARAKSLAYPTQPPFAGDPLRMVDHIDAFVSDGGPNQLGFIRATKRVVPEEWFFQAHFYQDPVVPGSLGLESFLQLLKFLARQRWGHTAGLRWEAVALGQPHEWIYRGQIVPKDHLVTVEAVVTAADETTRMLTADGFLSVDGRVIYGLKHFTVRQQPSAP
jgi:3-hydroxymyristoyl/3-hydroxydecanoyl-(acyl carrier protein) dehydratase/malonyl CoA-acyl carrier protein transacylase